MTNSDHAIYADKPDTYFGHARTEIGPLLPSRTDRVLEIGCGAGATMKWLRSQRTVQYAAGVELFPEAADRAAAVFDVVKPGNVEAMELPAHDIDLVIALDVLEHLVDPWLFVKRLHKVLKPGGVIVTSIPNVGHYSVSLPLILHGQWTYADEGLLDRTHLRFFTERTAIELMTCSGLVLDKLERVRVGPGWMGRLSPSARWYSMKILERVLPRRWFDFQFLIRVTTA